MPDKRFASMQPELKDAMSECRIPMRDKQGFKDKPLKQLMRGVWRFATFLVGRPVLKGDQVPRDWRVLTSRTTYTAQPCSAHAT